MRLVPQKFEILSEVDGLQILKQIEKVGRTCYKSEDKITNDSCIDFVKNLIKRGHEAMLEHYNITVRLTTDRGVSHEIVRHRVASYAQESTRYCNYSRGKFGNTVTYIDIKPSIRFESSKLTDNQIEAIYSEWLLACSDAENHYFKMLELGASPQMARSVLNNSTKTEICMTANLREWRHFFKLRTAKFAHPQIRELAIILLQEFKRFIPIIFDDIEIDDEVMDRMNSFEEDNAQISIEEWLKCLEQNVNEG